MKNLFIVAGVILILVMVLGKWKKSEAKASDDKPTTKPPINPDMVYNANRPPVERHRTNPVPHLIIDNTITNGSVAPVS